MGDPSLVRVLHLLQQPVPLGGEVMAFQLNFCLLGRVLKLSSLGKDRLVVLINLANIRIETEINTKEILLQTGSVSAAVDSVLLNPLSGAVLTT